MSFSISRVINLFLMIFSYVLAQVTQLARILFYRLLSLGTHVVGRPIYRQPIYCFGRGKIEFGKSVQVGVNNAPNFLSTCCYLNPRGASARISFGDNVVLNNGFSAIAERCSIKIGSRVLVGVSVSIYDSDFHGLAVSDRNNPNAVLCNDVVVGNDVFIGSNVIILKGVKIGDGAVVAAGAIVARDVPENAVVAGSPAKVIRRL